jgi:hypothetical protein
MSTRAETGRMQFGDDWPGIFVRGDNAMGYAMALDRVLRGQDDPISRIQVQSLINLFLSGQVKYEVSANPAPIQYATLRDTE